VVFERFRRTPKGPAEVEEAGAALKEAERSLKGLEKTHKSVVKERRRALEAAEHEQDRAVAAAKVELERRENERREQVTGARKRFDSIHKTLAPLEVGRFGKVVLYEDRIVTRDGEARLQRSVSALADTAAKIALARPNAVTRLAAEGKLDGRSFRAVKGYDARRFYLLIDAPELVTLLSVRGGDEEEAGAFAARVNVAALNARRLENERDEALFSAEREIASAEGATGVIAAAAAEVERLESDMDAVEEARVAFEEAEADTYEVDAQRTLVEERRAELETARAFAAAVAAAAVAKSDREDAATEQATETHEDINGANDEAEHSVDGDDAGEPGDEAPARVAEEST